MGFFVFVSIIIILQITVRKSNTIGNKMKVNPKQYNSRWRILLLHVFVAITLVVPVACDFDIPEKFEMPTWYLDLKIPLVQEKWPMSDFSNPELGIFLNDDSLGFTISMTDTLEATALPDLPPAEIDLDEQIASGDLGALNIPLDDIPKPQVIIDTIISVVLYDSSIYLDTADYTLDTNICIGVDPFTGNPICVDTTITLAEYTPFSFPNDSVRHMPVEDQFDNTANVPVPGYNTMIVSVFNTIMGELLPAISQEIPLGLNEIPLDDIPMIASIDGLVIKRSADSSKFVTSFSNKNIPTDLINVHSYLATGTTSLSDTLANHNSPTTIAAGETASDSTNLGDSTLANFLKLSTNMTLENSSDAFIPIPAGSLYVKFKLEFQLAGFDSLGVTTNNYSLSDQIEMPDLAIPDMDMSANGISGMKIYKSTLKDEGALYNENKLIVNNLQSTLPFDLNFLMNFKNFAPTPGNDSVKIDTILSNGVVVNKTFDMKGYGLQSPLYPDSAMGSFDLDLDISIPSQYATIPLDGSSLGEFTMDLGLEKLSFSNLEAYLQMEMPSEPTTMPLSAEGMSGVMFPEAVISLIFKNQIRLPIDMTMEFLGIDSLIGDTTRLLVEVDTIGFPLTDADTDTSMTVISLSKLGTTIDIYESVDDSLPVFTKLTAPCDSCVSIIGLLASNPSMLSIIPEVGVDGRGEIAAGKIIQGGYKVTIPLVIQVDEIPPVQMLATGALPYKIEEFSHENRYKLRNSLIQSDLVSNITNAMPIGMELSLLLSNDTIFPVDSTVEKLTDKRDELATLGLLNPTDSLYIISKCSELSPDSGDIYIFNVMTDYSECVDKMPYIVKSDGSTVDTVISYVDTLVKFIIPGPESYYGANDTSGFPEGMVALPGSGTYYSTIDTSQIFLLTDYGDHYAHAHFKLQGTDSTGAFVSLQDYVEINSFITFKLSSSGAFGPTEDVIIITNPNGGETLYLDESYDIQWYTSSTGTGELEPVNLYYSVSTDLNTYKSSNCTDNSNWVEITTDLVNIDSLNTYNWDLTSSGLAETDTLRIKILSTDGKACDINGYFIKIKNSSRSNKSMSYHPKSEFIRSRK